MIHKQGISLNLASSSYTIFKPHSIPNTGSFSDIAITHRLMKRHFYSDTIKNFIDTSPDEIVGKLVQGDDFPVEYTQRDAWLAEITILRRVLLNFQGKIYFEYSIPRMGKRIDVVLLIGPVIFILEFKIGEKQFNSTAVDQVWDYALDLKNFHEPSHNQPIAPILIASQAENVSLVIATTPQNDNLLFPILCNIDTLEQVLHDVLRLVDGIGIVPEIWELGRYNPTPTIVEAAMALYKGHSVDEISRSDASAKNLRQTSDCISEIIRSSKELSQKSICFVTGVPGAGKTLVGLNIATKHIDKTTDLYSVFLSGNGPLVAILREALARDKVQIERERGHRIKKGEALRDVKMFIQNVHNFRDECLIDINRPPIEHVALFDEAQRAWNLVQTASFMRRRKAHAKFC